MLVKMQDEMAEESIFRHTEIEEILKAIRDAHTWEKPSELLSRSWFKGCYLPVIKLANYLHAILGNAEEQILVEKMNTNSYHDICELSCVTVKLVNELIGSDVAITKISSSISTGHKSGISNLQLQSLQYYESSLLNILQTAVFYVETIDCLGDICNDLLDYCYRKVCTKFEVSKGIAPTSNRQLPS
jgi:hypothetical protein